MASCSEGVGMDYKERSGPAREVSFQLEQRADTLISFWGEKIYLHIDDITGGQTKLTVRRGKIDLISEAAFAGDEYEFSIRGKYYRLTCNKLENFLVGYDIGHFTLEIPEGGDEIRKERRRELARIGEMLELIKHAHIEFIRNGVSYTGEQAYTHLKGKWERAKNRIKTVDSFISEIASKSTFSGEYYLVRLEDGTTLKTRDWLIELKQQLD
jgi:hypothetical protein